MRKKKHKITMTRKKTECFLDDMLNFYMHILMKRNVDEGCWKKMYKSAKENKTNKNKEK